MHRLPSLILGLSLCTLAVARPAAVAAQSQATTGLIRGVVTDPEGNPVSGAQVRVRETQTNFQRAVVTDANGVFIIPLLPLGTYNVTARAVGFNESRQTGLPLRVGETADLKLSLAAVTLEAIEIVATTPVVDATRIEAATRLPDQAISGLPNNGRNYLNLTLLTPNVAIVQGPDGDELTVAGQKGIHNNVSVDGADFNNPFFGEQRGGQRPPFTFNLDAVQEVVVVAGGANAEFGRSSGGFVNVITKSGTNELKGSAHYYGKYDALSGRPYHLTSTFDPDFSQHQFGFTLGGPIKRDKAFFFVAYDQQVYDEVKQKTPTRIGSDSLRLWMDTAFGGVLAGDYGPIARTNDARALIAKVDYRLSERHNASLKYNYTWSEQRNGTFDVDAWGRSANALEKDFSHAINGSLTSFLSSTISNEFRFQYSREDRPRPYEGPTTSLLTRVNPSDTRPRPFPDTGMDFGAGYRFGMPFFIPIDYYDTRVQLLNNLSVARGRHLFKFGVEWNRVESVQTFIGFANGRFIFNSVRGFMNYVINGSGYRECVNAAGALVTTVTNGVCPAGTSIGGPVLLYLQQAGVPPLTVEQAGTQSIPQTELAVYAQDTWKPSQRLTINYGLRWEAQTQPDPITPPSQVFYAPYIGTTRAGQEFPSDGTIPSDKKMWQPRFGFAYDVDGTGKQVLRGSAGIYYARIPGLNLASSRSTNGSRGQTLAGGAFVPGYGAGTPAYDSLLVPGATPIFPDVFVFDKNFQNPRTTMATLGWERQLAQDLAFSVSYTHARTDHLTRFINRNDAAFGRPWSTGLPGLPGNSNGIFTLTTIESSARSRYNGVTFGLKRVLDPDFQFQANYTMSWDKSDDDNERDPFTFRYARASRLGPEYNWSDRDQRHRFNGWLLMRVLKNVFANGLYLNNRVSAYSAQPISERCGAGNIGTGERAVTPGDRICPDGSILKRNTLRKDNAFFSWDLRISAPFDLGPRGQLEAIVEIFNLAHTDNFRDPSYGGLLFNFDGTIRSGLGDPRQAQAGVRWVF